MRHFLYRLLLTTLAVLFAFGNYARADELTSTVTYGGTSGAGLQATYAGPVPTGNVQFGFQSGSGIGEKSFVLSGEFSPTGTVTFTAINPAENPFSQTIAVRLADGEVISGTNELVVPVSTLQESSALAAANATTQQPLFHASVQSSGGGTEGAANSGGTSNVGSGNGGSSGTGIGSGGSSGAASSENLVPTDCQKEPCPLDRLKEVAENIFNFLIKVGGAAAVLAVVIAGIRYIVAALGGESGAIQAAKQGLLYAIIGTAVLLTAYVIVRTVFLALGVSSTGSNVPGLQ